MSENIRLSFERKAFLLTVFLCLANAMLYSQETAPSQQSLFKGFRIDFEQDFLLEYMGFSALNSDRNYTQGFGVSILTRSSEKINNILFPYQKRNPMVLNLIFPTEFSFQFGAFTPDEFRDSLPVIGDRPYSTIFLLGMKNTLLNTGENKSKQKSIYVGAVGIDGPAKKLQMAIHVKMNEKHSTPPHYLIPPCYELKKDVCS